MLRSKYILFIVFALLGTIPSVALGQSADNTSPMLPRKDDGENQPRSLKEMMYKMQVDKDKRDHDEMLERGERLLKLTEELETTIEQTEQVTDADRDKLETVEKLTKKVLGELGGDDDIPAESAEVMPSGSADGAKLLREKTLLLVDELKKTSRFSISATAIELSNAVLRIARFLSAAK